MTARLPRQTKAREPQPEPVHATPCDYSFVFEPDNPFLRLPYGATPIQCGRVIAPALGRLHVVRICTINGKIRDAYHTRLEPGDVVILRTERGVAIPAARLAAAAEAIQLTVTPKPYPAATEKSRMAKPARRRAVVEPGSLPPEGTGIFTTFDPDRAIDEALPDGATVLDYLFAVDFDHALRLKALRINGKSCGFDAVPMPGDELEYFVVDQPTVNRDWLGFIKTRAARKVILQATALPARAPARYPSRQAEREEGNVARKDKGNGGFDGAKGEVTGSSYRQPGREGKKLIGAYVPEEDIPRFKAILKARGTNTQEYFAQIVANELAAAGNPAELERLMEAQLERFRATFRHLLPKLKR